MSIVDQKQTTNFGVSGLPSSYGTSYPPQQQQQAQQQAINFNNPWAPGGTQYPASAAAPALQQQQQQIPLQQQQQQQQQYSRPGSIAVPTSTAPYPPQAPQGSNHSSFSAEAATQQPQQHRSSFSQPGYPASAYPQFSQQPNPQHRFSHDYTNMTNQYAQNSQDIARRASMPYPPTKPQFRNADSYNDAMDASRGMIAMAQGTQMNTDITPRNIYGPSRNGSIGSYGFPETYSAHSSVSSASGYPYYNHSHNPSIDGSAAGSSITDYNSESERFANRILPVPGQMLPNAYPAEGAQAQMMNQFNSKLSTATQKKHKCKICDKRFTRPSSLQTHMYSHTGEKPFPCDHPGCGRHFSVVSNLRRHKKCHRTSNERSASGDEE